MEEKDKIDRILEWAEGRPDFDTAFVDSLDNYYLRHGELTEKQIEALDNIIEKFGIE